MINEDIVTTGNLAATSETKLLPGTFAKMNHPLGKKKKKKSRITKILKK